MSPSGLGSPLSEAALHWTVMSPSPRHRATQGWRSRKLSCSRPRGGRLRAWSRGTCLASEKLSIYVELLFKYTTGNLMVKEGPLPLIGQSAVPVEPLTPFARRTDSRSPGNASYLPSFFTKLESTSAMVQSKKQEIFRKLNSSAGADSDVRKWLGMPVLWLHLGKFHSVLC